MQAELDKRGLMRHAIMNQARVSAWSAENPNAPEIVAFDECMQHIRASNTIHEQLEREMQRCVASLQLAMASTSACAERAERDTAEYQKLEAILSDGARLRVDAAFRARFATITSAHASLSENALAVYRAGVAHEPTQEEADEIRSHLVDWYFGPVHLMTQLNFRNKGPEAAFGAGLIHAPTYLYLIMWRLGTCPESRQDLPAYIARYNREVRMARACGTDHLKEAAEKQMLGLVEAASLFGQVN